MGQTESQCRELSDEQVVYYTKQYFTINKVIEILSNEDKEYKTLSPPEFYMLDLNKLVPDLASGHPSDLTVKIYNPEMKTLAIQGSQPVKLPYTALNMYNDFILHEVPVLDPKQIQDRAAKIKDELLKVTDNLLKYITTYCGDIGIHPQQPQIQQVPQAQ